MKSKTPICKRHCLAELQGGFKNGSRRHEEADFGAEATPASSPRRLLVLRWCLNAL
jgi:hypothetical protein